MAVAAVQNIRLGRFASRATKAQAPALLDAYDALCRSMKLVRKPRLLISTDNQAPITYGAWKPVVMLPQALVSTLPLPEIRVILGHELAHNRRRDPWMAWLQVIISAIWWFNPIYWLLSRSIRSVREDCCDDLVLASGIASREVYCRTLLHAAQAALQNNAMTRAAFSYFGKSQPLHRRFTRIMSAKMIRFPKLAMAGLLAIFVLALILLPGVEPRILAQNTALSEGPVVSTRPAPPRRHIKDSEGVNKEGSEKNYILGDLRAEQPRIQNRNIAGEQADSNPSVFTRMEEYFRIYGTNPPDQRQPQPSPMNAIPDYYGKWLDEDVFYIITSEEKNEFLTLKNNNERESFIEQFWTRRGPTSKAEHYRRIAYANQHFATSIPGWKTDRGRIYIVYGKPDEIESHPKGSGTATIYPFEKWRYRHIDGVGDDIEIEFVDMNGEYRMAMSPDEKESLMNLPAPAFAQQPNSSSVYIVGEPGVKAPEVLYQLKPAYTDEARIARVEGIIVIQAIFRKTGAVDSFKVLQALGYGLDESAINTIATKWRFRPGTFNGEPVDVQVNIEVSFQLYGRGEPEPQKK